MFFTYIRRELRRRSKQAIVVALGLAIGIGLVVTVSAASAGVKAAQSEVLHSLDGVGTDMTVSKTAAAGTGGPQHFGGFQTGKGNIPKSGQKLSRNTLRASPGSGTLSASDVAKVASLHGTAVATGGLELTDTSFSGTIPNFGSGGLTKNSSSSPSFNISSFTVDGVQISSTGVGPLAPSQVTSGSYFSSSDRTAKVAVVSSSYAASNNLHVGSTINVAGNSVKVLGLADTSSGSADVFLPLGTAQALAGLPNDITTIYVSASSAGSVSSLASEVKSALPGTTVATSASLAKEVTGTLTTATNLASKLGRWLSIAALAVAFLVAGLLMVAAVSRRVREFGTLKAVGWRTRRIVGQVMGEGVVLGVAGGLLGILLGVAGAEIVTAVSPSLTATVGPASPTGGAAGGFLGGRNPGGSSSSNAHNGFGANAHTVLLHLTAPLQGDTIAIAVGLAIAGGLVAGLFGSWRAARLRPAAALRRVE